MGDMQMPSITRRRAAVYSVVVLAVLGLGGRYVLARSAPAESGGETVAALVADQTSTGQLEGQGSTAATELVVHIVGAVRRPGLYRLAEGARIDDAIRRAGGPTRRASLALLNLAAPLADGQQVVVPRIGDAVTAATPSGGLPGSPSAPVHLNTATLAELDALPGVGPVTAANILAYRDDHGPFRSVDELDAVTGIGPARLEQLRELVEP